ncbi:MAG: hypothetical protein AAGA03_16090 [Planctomycetota bacterium]
MSNTIGLITKTPNATRTRQTTQMRRGDLLGTSNDSAMPVMINCIQNMNHLIVLNSQEFQKWPPHSSLPGSLRPLTIGVLRKTQRLTSR